ncbi:MAG: hypothetical protein JO127_11015 [Caulobacteraceae bacterium]|nr:hypothetical protein [Caulobacteraceae bacterium]
MARQVRAAARAGAAAMLAWALGVLIAGPAWAAPASGCDASDLGRQVEEAVAPMSQRAQILAAEIGNFRRGLDYLRQQAAPLRAQAQSTTAAAATYDGLLQALHETSMALGQLLDRDMSSLMDAYAESPPARDGALLRELDERLRFCEQRIAAAQRPEPQAPAQEPQGPAGAHPQAPRYRTPGFGRESP